MAVGSLHEDGHGPRILALLHEGELVLPEDMFIDDAGVTEARLVQIFEAVQGQTSAGESQALHVSPLGASKSQDALLGEHVQRQGVDTCTKVIIFNLFKTPDEQSGAIFKKKKKGTRNQALPRSVVS